MSSIRINNNKIGGENPVYIIAELSCNHLQDLSIAKKTIEAIAKTGANAIKIQTDDMKSEGITIDSNNEYFTIKGGTLWDNRSLFDLYTETYTPWEWHKELKDYVESFGLDFFSTPSCNNSTDFLDELGVPAYKIASFEITDTNLIKYVASKGKPIIISTGIASLSDIENAYNACKESKNEQIIFLKCTSSYPTPFSEINLKTIPHLKDAFGTVVGLSDHTLGHTVPLGAVSLGAKVIEKHVILDRSMGGPDAEFSMEPQEFKEMVDAVRNLEQALGTVRYEMSDKTIKNRDFARSLFIVKDVKAGEKFTESNVKSIRPGYGISPSYLSTIIGKKAKKSIERGTPMSWDLI